MPHLMGIISGFLEFMMIVFVEDMSLYGKLILIRLGWINYILSGREINET